MREKLGNYLARVALEETRPHVKKLAAGQKTIIEGESLICILVQSTFNVLERTIV